MRDQLLTNLPAALRVNIARSDIAIADLSQIVEVGEHSKVGGHRVGIGTRVLTPAHRVSGVILRAGASPPPTFECSPSSTKQAQNVANQQGYDFVSLRNKIVPL